MSTITIKQGEAKTIKFTVTSGGTAVDLTDATLTFAARHRKTDDAYIIEKEDTDFNKTLEADGIVTAPLSATDTDQEAGKYYAELRTAFAGGGTDKSDDIIMRIEKAVIR
jgi:hypothetical protein